MKSMSEGPIVDPARREILARQTFRYTLLRHLHDLVDGSTDPTRRIDLGKLAVAVELERTSSTLLDALRYLVDEKLAGQLYEFRYAWLTHAGLTEVEQAIRAPDRGTKHFEPTVTLGFVRMLAGKQHPRAS
jgi:hypothetical protein